jgi:hypothetical protein
VQAGIWEQASVERDGISGIVEVDETYVGALKRVKAGSVSATAAWRDAGALFLIAAENPLSNVSDHMRASRRTSCAGIVVCSDI